MAVTAPPPSRISADAPQNLTRSKQGKWVDLSFKVTEDERDQFRVEAALRRMSHKELLQAAMTLYREHFPVPER